MIAKAIVEEVIDQYNIRVRIPSIDRTYQSSVHVNKEDLDVAVICTLPGCDPNIKVGDIVIVASDDAEEDTLILGHLYRTKKTETLCDMLLSKLNVTNVATLPEDTTIGNVSSFELQQLSGIRGNVQLQITQLQEQVANLTAILFPKQKEEG